MLQMMTTLSSRWLGEVEGVAEVSARDDIGEDLGGESPRRVRGKQRIM